MTNTTSGSDEHRNDDERAVDDQPSFVKKWLISTRPFALPASTMPVVFGTALAVWQGAAFEPWLFLMALVAMVCLHTGSNLLNDIGDFRKGVDTTPSPMSGGIVRGIISVREAAAAAVILLLVGCGLGVVIVAQVGLPILYLGLVGVAIGVLYTLTPVALKYHALGDLAVFLNFGILGSLGAWTVQTGSLSIVPAIWAVPIGMLVAGILHANNWRDIRSDSDAAITTVASLLGDRASMGYYGFLIFGAFAFVLVLVGVTNLANLTSLMNNSPAMPLTFVVVLLALPLAIKLLRRAAHRTTPGNPIDFVALDGATAQLNLAFGLLCTGALGLDAAIGWMF